jgi:hypothetical protein
MEQHLGKRQRVDAEGHALQPSYGGYNPMYAPANVPAQQQQPQPQPRMVTHNDLWSTIRTLDEAFVRETLFHAAVGNLSQPQILSKVVEVHDARSRNEAGQMDAHRKADEMRIREENARVDAYRKVEESRLDQSREQVVDFDHHVGHLSAYLENDPVDGKNDEYDMFEENIIPRIMDIRQKASMPSISFVTRYNGLEALRKIAVAVCVNCKGITGGEIASKFIVDHRIETSMLSILKAMTPKERKYLCHFKSDELEWWEKVEALWELGDQKFNGQDLFKRLDEVIEVLKNDVSVSEDEGALQQQQQQQQGALSRTAPPLTGTPVQGPGPMVPNQQLQQLHQFSSPHQQQQQQISPQQQQQLSPAQQQQQQHLQQQRAHQYAQHQAQQQAAQQQAHAQAQAQAQVNAQRQQYQNQVAAQAAQANQAHAAQQPPPGYAGYYGQPGMQQGLPQNMQPYPPMAQNGMPYTQ